MPNELKEPNYDSLRTLLASGFTLGMPLENERELDRFTLEILADLTSLPDVWIGIKDDGNRSVLIVR